VGLDHEAQQSLNKFGYSSGDIILFMYAFIGGTSAAGKTYIAKKFAKKSKLPIHVVSIDEFRKEFAKDPKLKYWVDILWNENEEEYWKTTNYEKDIKNLIGQSEAFWPSILNIIKKTKKNHEHAIFEAVNIQPHLAKKDLDFSGLFLINEDYKTLIERFKKNPRWGKTDKLQKLEIEYLLKHDVAFIKKEAKKYGYKVFNNSNDAFGKLDKIFNTQQNNGVLI